MVQITGTDMGETIDEAARGGSPNGNQIDALGGNDLIIAQRKSTVTTVNPNTGERVVFSPMDDVDGGAGLDTYRIDASSDWSAVLTFYREFQGNDGGGWTAALTSIERFHIVAFTHGSATSGAANDIIDARPASGFRAGNYNMGAGDDVALLSGGTATVNMDAGSDRLVLEYSFDDSQVFLLTAFSGDLASGYSGGFRKSNSFAESARVNFSGVEHFTITTGGGDDTITTGDGDDGILLGAGNDLLIVGRGNDAVQGGDGVDALSIDLSDEAAGVTINLLALGAQQNQQTGGTGSIGGFESFAGAVVGSAFDDVLIEGVHVFNAEFATGAGNDLVQVSRGTDTADLGAGSDRLVLAYGYNDAQVFLLGESSGDLASGYSGGFRKSDSFQEFARVTFSGVEHFTITTGGGADTITTRDGNDVVSLGAGNDLLIVGRGNDAVDGGAGVDALGIDLSDEAAGVTINLLALGAQQTGGTGSITGFESFAGAVVGSEFGDVLIEGVQDFNAQFSTGAGNDLVQVSRGSDTADLGAGSDRLVVEYGYNDVRVGILTTLSGDLASGYAGGYFKGDSNGEFARISFSGVEHFTITTGGGADTITTGDGDDVIDGGAGDDTLNAAGGTDTLSYATAAAGVVVDLRVTTAQDTGGAGTDTISNFENLIGSAFADTLFGTDAANVIDGGAGNDNLDGGAGNDRLEGDDGDDALFGFAGDDSLFGEVGNDRLFGGEGNDTLIGGAGDDLIGGGAGDDVLEGGDGNDYLYGEGGRNRGFGGAGGDVLIGGIDDDLLGGGDGADIIEGGAGNDYLYGEAGNDRIYAQSGNDTLIGGEGDDLLGGGDGLDVIEGGVGNDYIYGEAGNDRLFGQAGDDILFGGDGDDEVGGGEGNDLTFGGSGNDYIFGEAGGDIIFGEDGDDTLLGQAGIDNLIGGNGNDVLTGGEGGDAFGFNAALGAGNVDTITDFASTLDRLVLSQAAFTGLALGPLAAGQFALGTAAADADDRIVYDQATGRLFYDADGSGAGAAVQFAVLNPGAQLLASDIFVI